jgi:hypothetical protein
MRPTRGVCGAAPNRRTLWIRDVLEPPTQPVLMTTVDRSEDGVAGTRRELAHLGDRLREAEPAGASYLLEGCAGSGKSLLLEEARRSAAAADSASPRPAQPGDDAGAMTPLWSALFDGAIPVLDRVLQDLGPIHRAGTVGRASSGAHLEQVSGRRPRADLPGTTPTDGRGDAAAVRVLTRRLRGSPVRVDARLLGASGVF